jgi:chemotaxis protein CheC
LTDVHTILDEMEHDALVELVNMGVARAAGSLREMVGEQVHLSVPSLALVSKPEAVRILGEREPDRLVAVHQQFDGDFSGRALLIFPETKSLELVRALTGGELPLEDIVELEQEALAETGNVILNACLATIANMLERTLRMSLPDIVRGRGGDLMALSNASDGEVVLFLYIDFAMLQRDIKGYIVFLMDMPSLISLKGLIGEFIVRATGAAPPAHG